jgi:hypothetical protein
MGRRVHAVVGPPIVVGRLEPPVGPSAYTTEIHKGLHPRRRPFLFQDNS